MIKQKLIQDQFPEGMGFKDQKGDFTINKANFPENILIYANQGSISTLKGGDYGFSLNYVILGQKIYLKISITINANQMRLSCVCLTIMLKQESLRVFKIG